MFHNRSLVQTAFCAAFFLAMVTQAVATPDRSAAPVRQYPLAGAREVSPRTSIGITAAIPFATGDASAAAFTVTSSRTGRHDGTIHFSLDHKTIIFVPASPFELDETVSVTLSAALSDDGVLQDSFSFATVRIDPMLALAALRDHKGNRENALDSVPPPPPPPPPPPGDTLPWNQLFYALDSNAPDSGEIFLATAAPEPQINNHLFIFNQNGQPLTFGIASLPFDFERQENGEMTYFNLTDSLYYGLDSNFRVIDTFKPANGYSIDGHELRVFKDGSYSLIGITYSTVPLSDVVPGAPGDLPIAGSVVQSFDPGGNLVFEWRGIDHYDLIDGIAFYVSGGLFDFEHANSLDIDSTGNYLLSNRNLSEVTKIDGQTGDIMWRMGGLHNQFTLIGDSLGFSCQHYVRWLPNGHMIMFDNGNYHPDAQSRAVEYAIDEQNLTARRVWQFYHNPAVSSFAMGSVQRLPNGNTFIGWGMNFTTIMTEVTPQGDVVFDVTSPYMVLSYRALKYPTVASASAGVSLPAASGSAPMLSAELTSRQIELSASIPEPGEATISLSDAAGRTLATLFHGTLSNQSAHFEFPTASLATGAYFCVLHSAEGSVVQPVMVMH